MYCLSLSRLGFLSSFVGETSGRVTRWRGVGYGCLGVGASAGESRPCQGEENVYAVGSGSLHLPKWVREW